jgi:hypothetical protein
MPNPNNATKAAPLLRVGCNRLLGHSPKFRKDFQGKTAEALALPLLVTVNDGAISHVPERIDKDKRMRFQAYSLVASIAKNRKSALTHVA